MEQNILVKVGADITNFSSNMQKATKGLDEFKKANSDTFDAFKKVGGAITGAGAGIAAGLGFAVKEASTFQSAFAGVRKTVDGSEADYARLEEGIRSMAKELPASASEIAGVAEAAGQLGIEKGSILDFTRTMVDLGESTNLTADEAATAFARFANITDMPQSEFGKLGSTVVELGNNLATTESEIVNMSMRLAAQGKQVGMTQSDIMGLAGAMSSVGINAEAGGSAMTTVLKKMQTAVGENGKELEQWAELAGMSSADFKKAFEEDAAGALNAVITGLGEAGAEGENMAGILADLGVKGLNESDTMMRLAGAGDLLGESLQIANKGWEENSALTDEAAQRYETFESKMSILKNSIVDLGISIGQALLPFVTEMVEKITDVVNWFAQLNPKVQEGALVFGLIAGAIALVAGPILLLIGFIPQIVAGFAAVMTVVKAVGAALAFLTSPIALVVAAVIALAILIYAYWDEIKAYTIQAWGAISEFFSQLWEQIKVVAIAAWTVIKASLIQAWNSIRESAVATWQAFTAAMSAVWEGVKVAASAAWEAIKSAASAAWNAIVSVVMAILTPFIERSKQLWANLKDGVTTIMNGLQTFLSGVWELIKNVILGAVLLILNLVTGNFKEMQSNAKAIMENIKGAITQIWNGIKQMFDGVIKTIVAAVKTGWNNLKNDTTAAFNLIKNVITNAWNAIKSGIMNAMNAIISAINNGWNSLKSATTSAMNSIKSGITSAWNAIKSFFSSTLPALVNIVRSKFAEMISAVRDKMSQVLTTISNLWNQALAFLRGINLRSIGANIIQGLINGIKSKATAVVGAIKDVASAITGKIKSILNINSPSRVMAQIGSWTGEGLAIGIDGERKNVEKSAAKLAEAASMSVKSGVQFDTGVSFSAGSLAALETSIAAADDERSRERMGDIVMQVDGKEFARVNRRYIDEELGAKYRLKPKGGRR